MHLGGIIRGNARQNDVGSKVTANFEKPYQNEAQLVRSLGDKGQTGAQIIIFALLNHLYVVLLKMRSEKRKHSALAPACSVLWSEDNPERNFNCRDSSEETFILNQGGGERGCIFSPKARVSCISLDHNAFFYIQDAVSAPQMPLSKGRRKIQKLKTFEDVRRESWKGI